MESLECVCCMRENRINRSSFSVVNAFSANEILHVDGRHAARCKKTYLNFWHLRILRTISEEEVRGTKTKLLHDLLYRTEYVCVRMYVRPLSSQISLSNWHTFESEEEKRVMLEENATMGEKKLCFLFI